MYVIFVCPFVLLVCEIGPLLIETKIINSGWYNVTSVSLVDVFTLGIIYSTNAGGAKQMPETNNLNQT